MVSKGLIQEIDHDKIPFKYIDKKLLNKVYDKGNKYSIPKDYGVAGVVYDPTAVGGTIKTWSDFFDAAAKPGRQRQGADGRVGLRRDRARRSGPTAVTGTRPTRRSSRPAPTA